MVLDVKAMEWAAENGIDTAKLKAARIPIYGKWYFPDLPGNVPLVNLQNGHIERFPPGMRAGEVLYVTRADLRRARLGPYTRLDELEAEAAAAQAAAPAAVLEPEPAVEVIAAAEEPLVDESGAPIHMPGPSIYPLVLALGVAIMLLGIGAGGKPEEGGLIVRLLVMGLGFIYVLAGGIGWAMDNYNEARAATGPHDVASH